MKISDHNVCHHLRRVLFLLLEEHGDQESCCVGDKEPRGDGRCDPLTEEVRAAIFAWDMDEDQLRALMRRLLDLHEEAMECCNRRPYLSEASDEARICLGLKLDTDCFNGDCRAPAIWKSADPAPGNRTKTESGPLAWTHVLQPIYFWCEEHKPEVCIAVSEPFPVADIEWASVCHIRPQGPDGRILSATHQRPQCLLGHKIVMHDDEAWCETTNDFLWRPERTTA